MPTGGPMRDDENEELNEEVDGNEREADASREMSHS